jgi:tetratricopeptide (TPR) repeat protein
MRLATQSPVRRPLARLALPLAALLISGCAVVGRGGRDPVTPVPAPATTATADSRAQAKAEKSERKRAAREAKRAAAEAKRSAREEQRAAGDGRREPLDPLAEARLRATEQPGEPWWPYRAALLEAEAGRATASEASLRSALERDSAYAPALARLSRLLYEQGRHAEAVRLLAPVRDQHVSLGPEDRSAVLAGLALHEVALGREVEARGAIASLGGDERENALGVASYLAVRWTSRDSALRLARSAVRAAPGSAARQNNLGIALLRSGDVAGAEKAFLRAIEMDPARPGAYYNLAILERFYRLDAGAAARHFRDYWSRSHADPDSLRAELANVKPTPVAEGNGER